MKTLSLEQFIEQQKAALESFRSRWLKEAEKDLETWPLKMAKEQWFDQFLTMLEYEMLGTGSGDGNPNTKD